MPKDKFADLPDEFRDFIDRSDREEIKSRIAQVSLDQVALMEAKDKDTDLANAREQAREAGAIYREGTKMNKLKIEYASQVLDAKGG